MTKTHRDKMMRAGLNFDKEIIDIIKRRITLGKDNPLRPKSTRRITEAIPRHRFWLKIKNDIINNDLKDDIINNDLGEEFK